MSNWYRQALTVINDTIDEKGINNVTIKDIDNSYPFGERKRYPYKAWLKARKYKLRQLGLIKDKNNLVGLFE